MDRLTAQGQAFAGHTSAAYNDRCTIRRKVSAKSGLDTTYTPQVIATDVPCRITPSSASEREIAGATQGSTAYTVRMALLWDGGPIDLDSTCVLDIAAVEGRVEAHSLQVVAPLPSSSGVLEAVAIRQS